MPILGRVAGFFAIASGLASVALFVTFERFEQWLIPAWNLLIVPAAIYLGVLLLPRNALIAATATLVGVTASTLWALGYHDRLLEPWWIGLAALWWAGVGWLLLQERPRLGRFTLLLAGATALDFVLTAAQAPMPIYALGGFKIPLSMVWNFWVGISLISRPSRAAGADAMVAIGPLDFPV